MKVILLEDIKSLGKKGEIVEVSDGYARNVILKKKQGVEATSKNLNDLILKKANDAKIAQEQLEAAEALKKEIEAEDKKVVLKMKTGEGGKTFGSVSVKEQLGYDIDKKKIQMKEPVKSLGMHRIPVRLNTKVTAELKVSVQEE